VDRAKARAVGRGIGAGHKVTTTAGGEGLNSGSGKLPWTSIEFHGTSAIGQRVVIIGRGVVFSKDANGRSGRGVHKHVIAATVVSKRLDAGVVGKRASGIAQATKVWSGDAFRRNGIGSDGVSDQPRQLMRQRRARASAQHRRTTILRGTGVNGRVATNISKSGMNMRVSVFAAWRVVWLCVACWIGNRVTARGVGISVAPA
jgi:hypothetical protein